MYSGNNDESGSSAASALLLLQVVQVKGANVLIVCNGAAKSGSTWLYNIIQNISEFDWPDSQYLSKSNTKHPTIKETRLTDYLKNGEFRERDVISKNHYGKQVHRELLLSSSNTRILDVSRDTRDVIVSSYYDECRRNGFSGSFGDYYWQTGRLLVDRLSRYHEVWAVPHTQILVSSYESLKTQFDIEVTRIAAFLGVVLDEKDLARIDAATNIESLRQRYSDDEQYNTTENPFFRKGEVGDWKNHFDARMISDYQKVEQSGIGKFDLIHLKNRVRNKLKSVLS